MIRKITKPVYFLTLFLLLLLASDKNLFGQQFTPPSVDTTGSISAGNLPALLRTSLFDPDKYIIGPGDKFYISIKGVEYVEFSAVVNVEGALIIPKTGIVELLGKTLSQAKNEIRKKILSLYKGVELGISLSEFKKIHVSISGEVKKPSPYVFSANSHIYDAILRGGGMAPGADMRDVELRRLEGSVEYFDYTSFLRFNKKEDNHFLREGDVIKVNKTDRFVSVMGAVVYPGPYGFKAGESVADIIALAGGYLDKAKTDTIELVSFDSEGKNLGSRFFISSHDKLDKIILSKGDKIIIREIPEIFIDRMIVINGKIKYSGAYKIQKDRTTLSEIVREAGGFLEDASLKDSYIIRHTGITEADPEFERIKLIPRSDMTDDEYDYIKAKSRLIRGKMIVDFERLFQKNELNEDIILKNGDEVFIPEKKSYITVAGQVQKPGNIIYKSGLTVADYIGIAGGFSWRALKRDIRVIRANTNEWIDAGDVDIVKPGDVILVPEDTPSPKFWDIFMKSLTIAGQVATVVAATVAVIISTRK